MHVHRSPSGKLRHPFQQGLFLTLTCALNIGSAHAALLETCRASDSPLACKLRSVLTMLDTAAWILGLLLVVAVIAAVFAYRRKERKLTSEDISPDDL